MPLYSISEVRNGFFEYPS